MGLEIQEGLRKITFSNLQTAFVINDNFIPYFGGFNKEDIYKKTKALLKKQLYLIPASEICKKELNNEVVSGIYLLGYSIFRKIIPLKARSILEAIEKTVPEKYLELNKKAFNLAKNG